MSIYNQEVTGNHCWCFLLHMEYDNFHITSKTNDKSLHSYIGAHRGPFSLREPLASTMSKKGGKCNSLNCSFPAGFWLELPRIYEEVTPPPSEKTISWQSRGSPKSAGESYGKWGKTPFEQGTRVDSISLQLPLFYSTFQSEKNTAFPMACTRPWPQVCRAGGLLLLPDSGSSNKIYAERLWGEKKTYSIMAPSTIKVPDSPNLYWAGCCQHGIIVCRASRQMSYFTRSYSSVSTL